MRLHYEYKDNGALRERHVITAATAALIGGTIGTGVLLGAGGTAAGMSMASSKDQAKRQAGMIADEKKAAADMLKNAPTPETAEQKAKEDIRRKRTMQARTGGKTILSSEYGSATGSTLLGE